MRTIESLKVEIRELMKDLARNGAESVREHKSGRTMNLERLAVARVEIYKSIAHRQGLIIEILTVQVKFEREDEGKAA